MRQKICFVVLIASLTGCGGLEISSLTVDEAKNAHKPDKKVKGYIVYHPIIVVEVKKIIEKVKEENGNGETTKITEKCVAGKPQTLPDYEKPFLLRLNPGIGKSNVDLKIEDGWRLAGIKTESDNTAWFTLAKNIAGSLLIPEEDDDECKPGLYRLSSNHQPVQFERIPLEVIKVRKKLPGDEGE